MDETGLAAVELNVCVFVCVCDRQSSGTDTQSGGWMQNSWVLIEQT